MKKIKYPIKEHFHDLEKIDLDRFRVFENRIDYLIAITPRTGSTALCSIIENTQLAGRPTEFFNPRGPVPHYKKQAGSDTFFEYLEALISQYKIGLFGFKIAWQDYRFFVDSGLDKILFKGTKFIYLNRKDVYAQAVSLFYAKKSAKYHYRSDDEQVIQLTEKDYNLQEISAIVSSLEKDKAIWEHYFSSNGIPFTSLEYEDFQHQMSKGAAVVFNYLGIPSNEETFSVQSKIIKRENPILKEWVSKTKERLSQA